MTEHHSGGHGRPAAHHQFGQGQKRAAGRPRGAIGEKAIVQRIAGELHKIQQNGQSIEVNTIELLLISMRNLAMGGHLHAAKWLSDYRARITSDPDNGGYLVVPEVMPVQQFIEREMFLIGFGRKIPRSTLRNAASNPSSH
jgi:hypothetical protein